MGDWASYALADFLMFTPATYARQYTLVNSALWPLHLLMMVLALGAAWQGRPGGRGANSGVLWLLVPAWGVTAWWFLHQHYAPISLAGDPWAGLFALEAALLAVVATRRTDPIDSPPVARLPGWLLFGYALVGHPLLGWMAGREATALEWFGLAPDPTVLATLGIVLMLRGASAIWLAVIPMTWCMFSGLTYLAMDISHGLFTSLLALGAVAARVLLGRSWLGTITEGEDVPPESSTRPQKENG